MPINLAIYCLAILSSIVADRPGIKPLYVPLRDLDNIANLAWKNLGENNKNWPKSPPYPRLPTPVITLIASAIFLASPDVINSSIFLPCLTAA